tara:strand:+ start:3576 stop:3884 length:309 start_codon:yes stop_codon:yes gene_type:complete
MSTTVSIVGNLSKYTADMIPVPDYESFISVKKVRERCHPIIPTSINWDQVTRDSWFMCIRPDNDYSYQFPIAESENRDDDYKRAKVGIQYFYDQKFLIYQIQ